MAINSTTDIHLAIEQLGLTGKGNTYALADRTMSDEMKTYRQALRDLPATVSNIYCPVFPTPPS